MTENLKEIFLVFLRLGVTSFGGPTVHISLMEEEFVRKRQWLTREHFGELLGLSNIIPGPNSTEMALHIGHQRAGWYGFFAAGLAFILPAVLFMTVLAWFYTEHGALPMVQNTLYFMKAVVVAVILNATWSLAKSILSERNSKMFFVFMLVLVVFGISEFYLFVIAGTLFILLRKWEKSEISHLPGLFIGTASAADFESIFQKVTHPLGLGSLFITFLKIGSLIYGSGYVLIQFLQTEFISRLGWLSDTQVLDAVILSQATPGPLFTVATFLGYVMAGGPGAVLGTLGIFTPAFIFVALSIRYWPTLKKKENLQKFVKGVTIASLALMFSVCLFLIGDLFVSFWLPLLSAFSLYLLAKHKIAGYWLILGALVLGITTTYL